MKTRIIYGILSSLVISSVSLLGTISAQESGSGPAAPATAPSEAPPTNDSRREDRKQLREDRQNIREDRRERREDRRQLRKDRRAHRQHRRASMSH